MLAFQRVAARLERVAEKVSGRVSEESLCRDGALAYTMRRWEFHSTRTWQLWTRREGVANGPALLDGTRHARDSCSTFRLSPAHLLRTFGGCRDALRLLAGEHSDMNISIQARSHTTDLVTLLARYLHLSY